MLDHWLCLAQEEYRVCVDPNMGGHIVEFSVHGRNALHSKGPAIGSTFWPAPQDTWGWPPPKVLDHEPYEAKVQNNTISLTSEVCPQTGLQLKKKINLLQDRMEVTYTMINPGETSLTYAPWEITRVGGGLTFYRSEQKPLKQSNGPVEMANGLVWHSYDVGSQTENQKIFGNGSSGWLANAYEGLLLVKLFPSVEPAKTAPGEAEIEIYAHGDKSNPYIEVEQQGEFQTIAPKAHIEWQVTWLLEQISQTVHADRKSLVRYTESLVQER